MFYITFSLNVSEIYSVKYRKIQSLVWNWFCNIVTFLLCKVDVLLKDQWWPEDDNPITQKKNKSFRKFGTTHILFKSPFSIQYL